MAVNLLRDAKVYLSTVSSGWDSTNTWEVKVLDGFSFSQNTSTQEVTLNEAGASPNRGQKVFNTALDPVDFSFSTYVRPYNLAGVATPGYQTISFTTPASAEDTIPGLTASTTYDFVVDIDGGGSNTVAFTTGTSGSTWADLITDLNESFSLAGLGAYAELEGGDVKVVSETTGASSSVSITDNATGDAYLWTSITGGTVNSAVAGSASGTNVTAPEKALWDGLTNNGSTETPTSMDIDFRNSNAHELPKFYLYIDVGDAKFILNEAIINSAEIDFSIDGIGTISWSGQASTMDTTTVSSNIPDRTTDVLLVPDTASFIKNKLSTVEMSGGPADSVYNLGITSASVSIDNGVSFLTPEELGIVNKPIGHFTGTRAISGNITCYLDTDANKSMSVLSDMLANTDTVTNSFNIILNLGGPTGNRVAFEMPRSHIVIPQIDSQDVISTSIDFTALGTRLTSTDEMTVSYYTA